MVANGGHVSAKWEQCIDNARYPRSKPPSGMGDGDMAIGGSRGGLGARAPPRPFEIECFFFLIFLLVYVSWQIGLSIHEYRGR